MPARLRWPGRRSRICAGSWLQAFSTLTMALPARHESEPFSKQARADVDKAFHSSLLLWGGLESLPVGLCALAGGANNGLLSCSPTI